VMVFVQLILAKSVFIKHQLFERLLNQAALAGVGYTGGKIIIGCRGRGRRVKYWTVPKPSFPKKYT
jgi:hypothetical protein